MENRGASFDLDKAMSTAFQRGMNDGAEVVRAMIGGRVDATLDNMNDMLVKEPIRRGFQWFRAR